MKPFIRSLKTIRSADLINGGVIVLMVCNEAGDGKPGRAAIIGRVRN